MNNTFKTTVILLFIICTTLLVKGQDSTSLKSKKDFKATSDSLKEYKIKNYLVEEMHYDNSVDKSIYDRIDELLKINNPSFYFGHTFSNNLESFPQDLDLDYDEGKHGYLIDIQLANKFNIFRLRPSRHAGFWLLPRWTLDFEFTYRVANGGKNHSDSPGLPLNTKVGSSIVLPIPLFDNRDYLKKRCDIEGRPKPFTTNNLEEPLHLIIPKLQIMHYSNGQDSGSYIMNSNMEIRNDYATGNFSTNYLLGQIDYTVINKKNQLLNLHVGYRQDFAVGEFLSYEEGQNNRYGFNRLVGGIHLRTGPIIPVSAKWLVNNEYKGIVGDTTQLIKKRKLVEFWFSTRFEHVMDETNLLTGYKTSWTTEIGVSPLTFRAISFMIQWHYGRDYLNIRYDIPVSNIMLAATFNFNKYRPSFVSTEVK